MPPDFPGGRFPRVVLGSDARPYAFSALQVPLARDREEERNFYQVDSAFLRLVLRVEAEAYRRGRAAGRHTLFVVDQSSSMRSAYQEVKAAVSYMARECEAGRHDLDFLLYNTRARRASAQEVLESCPSGRTSFESAFGGIREYVMEKPPGTDMSVVFMTDGADNESKDLQSSKRAFAEFLGTCGRPVVVHAIGFTDSHHRHFLDEIRLMGCSEGMYRFAEKGDRLEACFAEMFDFVDVSTRASLRVGGLEVLCDAEESGDGWLRVDVLVPRERFAGACPAGAEPCSVTLGAVEVHAVPAPPDQMFAIRRVDESEIATQEELEAAQGRLHAVQVQKAPKAQRQEVIDAKQAVQARLDRYHQLFARGARSSLAAAGESLAAELSSLRHEATFSKARRARAMAQRATANAPAAQLIDNILRSLPPASPADLATLEAEGLTCALSGETVAEVVRDSHRDFFVFALRVRRPEEVVDAPTALDVLQVLSGTYSDEAFRAGAEHAIGHAGPEQAHGGFVGTSKHPAALGNEVGLFRGPDGQMMNACLPLYLSEAHFARVRVQIKPLLGYFFTLDPLGYKGDQTIAMFGVLGKMLCLRSGTGDDSADGRFRGSWADWLVDDFTKLCRGIQPIAMEYLAGGGYSGAVRGDLLEEFLATPAGRTKERLPSLGVIVGWAAALRAEPSPRFHCAFVEELWRRNFTILHKGQPREPIAETLERLLYGPALRGDGEAAGVDDEGDDALTRNSSSKDREFARWAQYLRGDLSKKQQEEVRKAYGTGGPDVEGLISAGSEYAPRVPMRYDDAAEFFDAIVESELLKIRQANRFVAALFDGRPFGEGFTPRERRLMLIQALQFVGNDAMNEGVAKGHYLNTFDCLAEGDAGAQRICGQLHERFEQHRREKWSAYVEQRNALRTARRAVAAGDLDAFAGRCAVSCPTRGGAVFDCVVALLAASVDGGGAGAAKVPMLREKVAAVLTGKIGEVPVISGGVSWIHCPQETARKLRDAVGEDEFVQIELSMHGVWGHVYRESNIPNRHGHSNNNPNPGLTGRFDGFRLA